MATNSSNRVRASFSLKALTQSVNRPSITLAAIVIALALGATRLPFLQYLRPLGDFYIALLKICVLPFLLSTIPLAVRSAMVNGSTGGALRSLIAWLMITLVGVAVASVIVTSVILSFASVDEHMIAKIGALVGQSSDNIDVEFAIASNRTPANVATGETGIFSVIPTNIFAALSANDSMRVLCFALIFGVGMVMTERQSGYSIFGALRHVQAVCITIFDWFSLLVPIGIVALIAPQVALLGPDAFTVLARFAYAFVGTSGLTPQYRFKAVCDVSLRSGCERASCLWLYRTAWPWPATRQMSDDQRYPGRRRLSRASRGGPATTSTSGIRCEGLNGCPTEGRTFRQHVYEGDQGE